MSHTPNQLDEDFPDMAERIHELKTTDNHFARLVEEYHELNRQIHRIETRIEPTSEDVEEELKRRRVRLKDEIAQMLQGAEVTQATSPGGREPALGLRPEGRDGGSRPGLRSIR